MAGKCGMEKMVYSMYYKTIQDCQSYNLQNLGLKIHNFSLDLNQSKTLPSASCWSVSTLVRRYVFFNPRLCKSWDCPISEICIMWGLGLDCHLNYPARRYIVMQKSTYWLLVALWLQFALFGSCAPNVSKLFKSRVPWETFWSTVESRRAHSQHFFFQIDLSFCQVTIMNKLVVLATVCLIGAHGKLLS